MALERQIVEMRQRVPQRLLELSRIGWRRLELHVWFLCHGCPVIKDLSLDLHHRGKGQ